MIKKRYMHVTEEQNNMCSYMAPSLDVRQDIVVAEVPKLGKEATVKAIQEWDNPSTTSPTSGVDMPGADYQLTKLLGLRPSVKRLMIYQQDYAAGGTVLCLSKDLAENNKGARVLVVCSEITAVIFRGPSETHLDFLLGQVLFGDVVAEIIVGADPDPSVEHPIFQLVSAAQTFLPDSDEAIRLHMREAGLTFHLQKYMPEMISKSIEECLLEAFTPIGINDCNSNFLDRPPGWTGHFGSSRGEVGAEGGEAENDEAHPKRVWEHDERVRFVHIGRDEKSLREVKDNIGEGLEWGVLFGFGPGVTVETVVLHSVAVEVVFEMLYENGCPESYDNHTILPDCCRDPVNHHRSYPKHLVGNREYFSVYFLDLIT